MPKKRMDDESCTRAIADALREMRRDMMNGTFTCVNDYAVRHRIPKFNGNLVSGLVNDGRDQDILDRAHFIQYHTFLVNYHNYNRKKGNGGEIPFDADKEIEMAVELLKSRGYKVMRPKVDYEEV